MSASHSLKNEGTKRGASLEEFCTDNLKSDVGKKSAFKFYQVV